jgi:C4-dicarboxylate-specific signal transduction histidine kinase
MTLGNLQREVDDPEHAERMNLMQAEVMRLSRLLSDLLNSARHQPEAQVTIDLSSVVKELLSITRYQLAPSIKLEARIEPKLACRAPESALRQALLNLILNAAAAVADEGGQVAIEGGTEADGQRVRITVTDDGPGFPKELLERGIRPFFSTREHGTGLGLAVVQRVVRDAGGQIELENCKPHGARVTLLLPSANGHG